MKNKTKLLNKIERELDKVKEGEPNNKFKVLTELYKQRYGSCELLDTIKKDYQTYLFFKRGGQE